jgi:hypothetical protein
MLTLSGQRFVGVSQADETRGERSSSEGRAVRTKHVNHAIKQKVEHDHAERNVRRPQDALFARSV